jgi:phage/plasmid-associated DNA primase
MTGLTIEQVILILWGVGANGKSTVLEVLRMMLSDYARKIPADSLMIRKIESGQSNDIAGTQGRTPGNGLRV